MTDRKLKLSGPLVVGGLVVTAISVAYGLVILRYVPGSAETKAYWGESFGALSALFGGLAFMGLVVTIFLQGKEISRLAEEQKQSSRLLGQQVQALKVTAKLNYLNDVVAFKRELLYSRARDRSAFETTEDAVMRQRTERELDRLVKDREALLQELDR